MIVKPYYFLDRLPDVDGEPNDWTPIVFDAYDINQNVPPEFNSVLIKIDGTLDADLDWKAVRHTAQHAIEQKLKLFWDLDLGLFSKLKFSLTDQAQYLSLGLSLDHFRDSLWKEFQAHTIGLCLYRGSADFSALFPWDEGQTQNFQGWLHDHKLDKTKNEKQLQMLFCRDAAIEYLNMLTRNLTDLLSTFVLLDTTSIDDPILLSQLLSKDLYERQQRIITEGVLSFSAFKGTHRSIGYISRTPISLESSNPPAIGVCLSSAISSGLHEMVQQLLKQNIPFRVIPEPLLTTEWDGLDYLLVHPESIGTEGIRKLRGFCAAGGTVVLCNTNHSTLGVAQEISFPEWISSID